MAALFRPHIAARVRFWQCRIVGYSRLAGTARTAPWLACGALRSDLIDAAIAVHHGRIVKRTGDGSIIEFRSVVDAVRCAIEEQTGMMERNSGVAPDKRIECRVGIHSDTTAADSAANECCFMRGVGQGVGFCGRPVNRVITR